MNLIFDKDKNTGELYAVDTNTLKEYLVTEVEFRTKKLSDKDPQGKPRWEHSRWKK